MTFLPQYSQLMLLTLEKNDYQYRSQCIMLEENANQRESERLTYQYNSAAINGEETTNVEDDPYYKRLQQITATHEAQQTAITNQISAIETMINTLSKNLSGDIQKSCGSQLGSSSSS